MKIGKFKKIAAIGLALTMAIGLLYTGSTVNATDENIDKTANVDNDNIVSFTDVGPFMDPVFISSNQKVKMARMSKNTNGYTSTTSYADGGLVLDKKAKYVDSGINKGKYEITLEAYTTGTVKTGNVVPTDIVLVLDDSGSMNYTFGDALKLSELDKTKPEGYYCYGERDDTSTNLEDLKYVEGLGWQYYDAEWSWDELGYVYSWKTAPNNGDYYVVRTEMLQDVCKTFIDSVEDSSTDTARHRVAIATYASSGYNKDNMSIDFQYVDNQTGKNGLYDTLDNLEHNGGTDSSIGLNKAYNYFKNDTLTGERNRVVIMFSDGEQDSSTARRDSLNASYKLKAGTDVIVGNRYPEYGMGSTVYTVGIFSGADPNDNIWDSTANRFMHYVSSNYPTAKNMMGSYEGGNNGYYLSASNSDDLADIFEKIADQIQPSAKLGPETTIKDFMSDYFKVDKSSEVKVYTQDYIGSNNFSDDKDDITNQIAITSNDNYVYVNGFDFTENAVVDGSGTISTSGKKLVIQFYVDRVDGFIGGNAVPTNSSRSGMYENINSSNPLEVESSDVIFAQPKVDVEIKYDATINKAAMFAGDKWSDFDTFIESINKDNGVYYKIDNVEYKLNGENNNFVDIVYTIKDGDNDVYTYKINEGNNGVGSEVDSIYLNSLMDSNSDKDYEVDVKVTPKYDAINNDYDNLDINKYTKSENTKLYLYIPYIDSHDNQIMLGDSVTFNNEMINLTEWKSLTDEGKDVVPTYNGIKNNAPELKYSVSGEDVSNNTFKPSKEGNYNFKYTVTNSRSDYLITDVSKYKENCDSVVGDTDTNYDVSNNNVIVHVKDGEIIIDKILNTESGKLQVDESDGTPIFTFQIDKMNGDDVEKSYFKTIKLVKDDGVWKLPEEVKITGLEKGTYKVTELPSMRYKFANVKVNSGTGNEQDGQTVTLDIDAPEAIYVYTNEVKDTKYDSDNGYLVNKVIKNDDDSYSMVKDQSSEG
ncbi:VWA domain-containing protein [Clostridium sp. C1]|uniref:VWA domain-containing protein n=1 Tax=Clostridium sp. C1 TaxID=1155388 RepID=UPI001BAC7546|nr:vWA domain-containing protein [Clostridium sp. C1]QUN11527.1 VWA domain-containing protein [Clostridium sp. C1]